MSDSVRGFYHLCLISRSTTLRHPMLVFLLKVMGLSLVISALIKFAGLWLLTETELVSLPRAEISVALILLPSFLLAIMLGSQLWQAKQ